MKTAQEVAKQIIEQPSLSAWEIELLILRYVEERDAALAARCSDGGDGFDELGEQR